MNLQRTQQPAPPSLDYSILTEKISQNLKAIHTYISDNWNDFLITQQTIIKKQIENSVLGIEIKNKMMELAIKRSIIQYSMMDTLADLSKIEKEQNIEAYKHYTDDFLKKYKNIIETACKEQEERYEQMNQYL